MNANEMIDRYFFAVGERLPYKKSLDIQAELRSAILDALEDRAGADPSLEQVAALLKEYGSPEKVAASYNPQRQYLIGPELFPLYRLILTILFSVWAIGSLVGLFPLVSAFTGASLGEWLLQSMQGFISMVGGLTIAFAIMQYFNVRTGDMDEPFDPYKLEKVEQMDVVSRPGKAVELTVELVFLAALFYVPTHLADWFPNAVSMRSPALEANLGLFLLSVGFGVLVNLALLATGRWNLGLRIAEILDDLFSLFVIYRIVFGGLPLVEFVGDLPAELAVLQPTVHMGLTIAFTIVMIVIMVDTVKTVYDLVKRYMLLGEPKVGFPAAK